MSIIQDIMNFLNGHDVVKKAENRKIPMAKPSNRIEDGSLLFGKHWNATKQAAEAASNSSNNASNSLSNNKKERKSAPPPPK